jgi:hypothetical protein
LITIPIVIGLLPNYCRWFVLEFFIYFLFVLEWISHYKIYQTDINDMPVLSACVDTIYLFMCVYTNICIIYICIYIHKCIYIDWCEWYVSTLRMCRHSSYWIHVSISLLLTLPLTPNLTLNPNWTLTYIKFSRLMWVICQYSPHVSTQQLLDSCFNQLAVYHMLLLDTFKIQGLI